MIGSENRGDMNNKQTHQHRGSVKSPKIGPKLTDKSWITRGLKPDLKIEYRDERQQNSFTHRTPQGKPTPSPSLPPPPPPVAALHAGAYRPKRIFFQTTFFAHKTKAAQRREFFKKQCGNKGEKMCPMVSSAVHIHVTVETVQRDSPLMG